MDVFRKALVRSRRAGVTVGIVLSMCIGSTASAQEGAPSIQVMIERGRTALVAARNAQGTWEFPDDVYSKSHPTGYTALAVGALVASGVPPIDERVARAIEFLQRTPTNGTYALGCRLQLWNEMPNTKAVAAARKADTRTLLSGLSQSGPTAGLWGYASPAPANQPAGQHMSTSNFGVLGVWSAAEAGETVPPRTWDLIDRGWRAAQLPDGRWSYNTQAASIRQAGEESLRPLSSMTSAGIATLLICQDYLGASSAVGASARRAADAERATKLAVDWLAGNVDAAFAPGLAGGDTSLYTLHNYERIGAAGGLRYFGKVDWFRRGVEYLRSKQRPDGGWDGHGGPVPNTAFALLFLAHGLKEVGFAKLDYDGAATAAAPVGNGGAARPADTAWDEVPRDVAALTRWTARATERHLRWEIVTPASPVDDLLQSRVLVIAGGKLPALPDAATEKLRDYANRGGLIVFVATSDAASFTTAAMATAARCFPQLNSDAWRELPADHPIFTAQQFRAANARARPRVLGLSNGVRELALIVADGEVGRQWAHRTRAATDGLYGFGANLYGYAGGTQRDDPGNLSTSTSTATVTAPNATGQPPVKIARLKWAGNWDPEPAAYAGYAARPGAVAVDAVPTTIDAIDGAVKVAHLASTTDPKLTDAEVAALRKFIDGGGTLLLESAGGSTVMTVAGDALLARLRKADETIGVMKSDDPWLTAGEPKRAPLRLRSFVPAGGLASAAAPLKVLRSNGRVVALLSTVDVSAGLAGARTHGFTGWDPASAGRLLEAIVSHARPR